MGQHQDKRADGTMGQEKPPGSLPGEGGATGAQLSSEEQPN